MSFTEYQQAIGALARAQADHETEIRNTIDWYAEEHANLVRAAQDASASVEAALAAARVAADAVVETDRRAAGIWSILRRRSGRRAARFLGTLPEPVMPALPAPAAQSLAAQSPTAQSPAAQSPAVPSPAAHPPAAQPDAAQPDAAQPDAAQPDAGQPAVPAAASALRAGPHLRRAAQLLSDAGAPQPLPWWLYPLMPFLGAGCALLGYVTAQSVLALGGPFGSGIGGVLTMLGELAALLAPLTGLPVAKLLCDRAGARIDGGIIALVILGGMTAIIGLVVILQG